MVSQEFSLEAGELCLDYANTMDWHDREQPIENLNSYTDLILWGEAVGILDADRAEHLRRLSEQHPDESSVVFDRAIRLREAIYCIFSLSSQDKSVNPDDLAVLNDVLSGALPYMVVTPTWDGFAWDWIDRPDDFDQILWPVARSVSELLTSPHLDRVRKCADDRGCGYLFLDKSKNRSRRWCSMGSCGNRAKAQRHYERTKEKGQAG
jgi:predicted RNA-binding Zn ribbon-like protein